jgi:L-threonylcarbamoyladenylate synthase
MNNEINKALEVLRQGGTILYPTDTIWGIGCDATSEEAVRKVYSIKQREDEKSMLLLLDEVSKLERYMIEIPEVALNILEVADKPLTIIYPGAMNVAPNLIAADGSIGIRITRDVFCKKLIARLGRPLVSTSANISGMPWPAGFHKIDKELRNQVDYTVQWRQHEEFHGKPSGIIKVGLRGEVKVIRE